jgi:hypothetical protein
MLSAKLMNSWKSVRITVISSKDILPVSPCLIIKHHVQTTYLRNKPVSLL